MPSKKQIYEIVAMQLSGGAPQRASQFSDPRRVYAVMDTIRDKMVYEFLLPQVYENKFVNQSYIFTYPAVAVQNDTARNVLYSDFPVKMISLPRDMNIYQIAPSQDMSSSFVRMSSATEWLFKDNDAITLQGNAGYYADAKRATYYQINPSVTSVLMRLVTAGQSIDDEEFYIGNELMDILIQATLQLLNPTKQQDLSNNNVNG